MSEIKLFRINGKSATEIAGAALALEKSLQSIIELNLEALFGVRLLASEHPTGIVHGGRIDTLGLDENNFPVIVEYKRAINENVINQGLYYLNWLLDHRADFKLLALDRYGKDSADGIDWTNPRLICIAADFTKFDLHAVQQINRNIDLIRYRRFGEELLALELVHSVNVSEAVEPRKDGEPAKQKGNQGDERGSQMILALDQPLRDAFEALRLFLLALGDDVTEKTTKRYVAFRRIKNFATVVVQKSALHVFLKLDPRTISLEAGFTRDVSNVGHWGTGDLELIIRDLNGFNRARPLIELAYSKA